MQDNNFVSKFQGTWQKGKVTTLNALTIINMYEEAKIFDKEIHTTYIDLVKTYNLIKY